MEGAHADGAGASARARAVGQLVGGDGLGVEDVVEFSEQGGEEDEGGACGEDALPHGVAGETAVEEHVPVARVLRVPHRPGQQARLRYYERHPALITAI